MLVSETRKPLEKFQPKRVSRRKVYELVEQRNEWTDWHGSTDIVNRTTNFADTKEVDTLHFMQKRAEARRKQGSHFIIRVIPVLLVENDQHCFMVGQKYRDRPLHGLSEHPGLQNFKAMKWSAIFAELMTFCLQQPGGVILIPKERGHLSNLEKFGCKNSSPCFHFASSPTQNAASLGWASRGKVDTNELDAFMEKIRRKQEAPSSI